MSHSFELYDLTGLKCPLPVLKTRAKLSGMPMGAKILVRSTDPMSEIDLPHFCNQSGHKLLETTNGDGFVEFLIEKGSEANSS